MSAKFLVGQFNDLTRSVNDVRHNRFINIYWSLIRSGKEQVYKPFIQKTEQKNKNYRKS